MTETRTYTKADLISEDQVAALDKTPCGLSCSGCQTLLVTEGDFARHFVLADATYLNLGECPNTEKGRRVVTQNVPYFKRGGVVRQG